MTKIERNSNGSGMESKGMQMKTEQIERLAIKSVIVGMFYAALIVFFTFGASQAKDLPKHQFPYGYCTWYVAQQTFIPFGGNANQWLKNAKTYDFKVYEGNSKAYKYAVLVTNEDKAFGHVAWITDVKGDTIFLEEMNVRGFAVKGTRTIRKGDSRIQGIILTKKAIKEKYHSGYEKYKKYKDNKKKYKKYKEYKDDYEKYKTYK